MAATGVRGVDYAIWKNRLQRSATAAAAGRPTLIYARVAAASAVTDNVVGEQISLLLLLAIERGLEPAMIIAEVGSGARTSTPGLEAIVKAAAKDEFDVLLTWDITRLGRNALSPLVVADALRKHGKTLEFKDGPFD